MTKQEFLQVWEKILLLPTRYERTEKGGVPLLMVKLIRSTTDASLNESFMPYYNDVEVEGDFVVITHKGDDETKDRKYIPLSSLVCLRIGKHIDNFIKDPIKIPTK